MIYSRAPVVQPAWYSLSEAHQKHIRTMSAVYLSSLDPTFRFATQEFSMVKSSETTKLSKLGSGHLHRAWRLPGTIWYRWIWPKPESDNHEHFECNQAGLVLRFTAFQTPYSDHNYVNDIHVEWLLTGLGLSKLLWQQEPEEVWHLVMSYTSTCDPDCQLTCIHCFKNDYWASEASNVMVSLGLGGIFNHTEAVY